MAASGRTLPPLWATRRGVIAVAAAVMAATAGPIAFAAELPVETRTIEKETDAFGVDASYPETGKPAIDREISGFVSGSVDDFIATATEDADEPHHYGLYMEFEVVRNDDRMFAVTIADESSTGGAHPNHDITTFNFMMPDGWRVFLPEIFEPSALKTISDLAIADLTEQFGENADTDWIGEGAGPFWDNFKDFVLLPEALELHFPDYQVAPYVAGEQVVTIPLSSLAGLVRKDWRTPVASFDCARAASKVEKAVCADVALARLDRDLATAYHWKLKLAGDDAERAKVAAAQKAWLGERDKACGGDVACLGRAYGARIKALKDYAG